MTSRAIQTNGDDELILTLHAQGVRPCDIGKHIGRKPAEYVRRRLEANGISVPKFHLQKLSYFWEEMSEDKRRLYIKRQDAKFRAAMVSAHPELAPAPRPKTADEHRDIVAVPPELLEMNPEEVEQPKKPPRIPAERWRDIIDEICAKHKVNINDLISIRRDMVSVKARQEAAWRMKQETPMSLPQIGARLGNRDHTTVLHAIRKHQARIDAGQA